MASLGIIVVCPLLCVVYNGGPFIRPYAYVDSVKSVTHSSEAARIATTMWGFRLDIFDERHSMISRTHLPSFPDLNEFNSPSGRFVFFSADGSQLYVIIQAQVNAGMANHFGLVSYRP